MYKLLMIRHGESVWNKENKFTGWTDVGLSEKGFIEAKNAGIVIQAAGFEFDIAFTSMLSRAIKTLNIVLDEMNQLWIPVEKSWRLNERHYGALQGLNKAETAKQHSEEQVKIWRRSYDVPPPALTVDDDRHPGKEMKYQSMNKADIPLTECLKDTVARFLPYWIDTIAPSIKSGKKVVIVAHGNSLRAAVKYLDNISDNDILELNIPTGIPLVYELDEMLKPITHYYLGDADTIAKAAVAVANQGKS